MSVSCVTSYECGVMAMYKDDKQGPVSTQAKLKGKSEIKLVLWITKVKGLKLLWITQRNSRLVIIISIY